MMGCSRHDTQMRMKKQMLMQSMQQHLVDEVVDVLFWCGKVGLCAHDVLHDLPLQAHHEQHLQQHAMEALCMRLSSSIYETRLLTHSSSNAGALEHVQAV
eukprot:528313-Pelagomonas_calceolata.AAC.2